MFSRSLGALNRGHYQKRAHAQLPPPPGPSSGNALNLRPYLTLIYNLIGGNIPHSLDITFDVNVPN